MADLFRKTSLEKLSSPEQLDKMIVITPPSFWIALLGAAGMIVFALVWSIFGRLPINVETQGIYVNSGGTYGVYSENAGIVSDVVTEEGDWIEEGDVIAYLDSEDILKAMDTLQNRMDMVQAVTIDSEADAVTADNKSLIDIKDQLVTVDQNLLQNQALLEYNTKKVAEQRATTNSLEAKVNDAEAAYFNSLNTGDSTNEQLEYSEAQSAYANASSYLESSYASLDQANVAYAQALGQYNNIMSEYNALLAQKDAKAAVVQNKAGVLQSYYGTLGLTEQVTAENAQALYLAGTFDAYPEIKEAAELYFAAVEDYNVWVSQNAAAEAEYQDYVKQYGLELQAAETTKNNYQSDVDTYAAQKDATGQSYVSAKNAYQDKMNSINQNQANQNKLSNEYNLLLNEFNSELAKLQNLEDSVEQTAVQIDCDTDMVKKQTKTIYNQFEATKASIMDQLMKEYNQLEEQSDKCTICSSVSGRVSEVSVVLGSAVNQGSQVIKVQQGDEEKMEIMCYVPLDAGKKITEGMKVLVYPTTVNRQEYGYMEASVESVDSYVSSTDTLRMQLGDDGLVETFLQNGPVVAVKCILKEDASTASGYYWSSKKGKSVELAEGTLVEASIVTEEKMPLSMLIPYLKEKLTIKANNSQ